MKKIMNEPGDFVKEVMEGIEAAYGDKVGFLNGDFRVLMSKYPKKEGKVGIVTAGGSGHLPLFLGYVGQGLVDGCAVGNVFASPSAEKMAEMIRAANSGSGVLCLFGNYGGDKMNFALACDTVSFEDDIETRTVKAADDVASSPKGSEEKRRGVAGLVYAFKIAKAAAEGSESTKEMLSVHGRAAYYGEKSLGVLDGGSVVGRLIFEAAQEYAETP